LTGRDEKLMLSALKLARRGIGSVEPNPVVGCIITKGGQIVGKGWHKEFGGPHAEINALADCKTLGVDPAGSTMYVTLEPCCHQGKTGPCTDAIIAAGVREVFVATIDPSPNVNGRGIEQLRQAGIEVLTGLCEEQARLLNASFIKFALTGRCWVVLKWAQSIDAKCARADSDRWLSNESSRKDAHILRRRSQAIVVGINTVLADNPLLTPRPARKGSQPLRVVLDTQLRIPLDCRLLQTVSKAPVLILTSGRSVEAKPQVAEQIAKKGAELLVFPDMPGRSNLHFLVDLLSKRGVMQLLVEGGPTVLSSFIKEGLADEVRTYIVPMVLGGRGLASIAEPLAELQTVFELRCVRTDTFDNDICLSGFSERTLREISVLKD